MDENRLLKLAELAQLLYDAPRFGGTLFKHAQELNNYFLPEKESKGSCKCEFDGLITNLTQFWNSTGANEFESNT